MKIAVLVKQTPDTETKAKVSATGLDLTGLKFILNPYDEYAVEEAIKTRDATKGTATVISVGPDRVIDAQRTALAMGCDDAIHIKVSEEEYRNCDSYVVAKALADVVKKNGFTLVLCGKQAIDDDALAVPQMVAELLGWSRASVVTKIEEISEAKIKVRRAIDAGAEEVVELTAPALIAAHKGLNTPRYASLPGIMKAKQKKIETVPLESLGLGAKDSRTETINFELPPEKSAGKVFKGTPEEVAQQIVSALRNEAKVI